MNLRLGVCLALALAAVLMLAGGGAEASSLETLSAAQTRLLLTAHKWSRHADDKRFFADGTFEARDNGRNYLTTGRWRLDGDRLSLTEDNETTQHRLIRITETDLELTFGGSRQRLHYRRSADG